MTASPSPRILSVARKLPWREANNPFQTVCLRCIFSSTPPLREMENPITNKEHRKVCSLCRKDLITAVNTNICAANESVSQLEGASMHSGSSQAEGLVDGWAAWNWVVGAAIRKQWFPAGS